MKNRHPSPNSLMRIHALISMLLLGMFFEVTANSPLTASITAGSKVVIAFYAVSFVQWHDD